MRRSPSLDAHQASRAIGTAFACLGASGWSGIVPIRPGDVISYQDMCQAERRNLQQGMHFRPAGQRSMILMNLRKGAPYADRIEDGERVPEGESKK